MNKFSHFNIEKYLKELGHQFVLNSSNQIIMTCPHCKKPKLYINNRPDKYGNFLCFTAKCADVKGNLIDLISMFSNLSKDEAIQLIYKGRIQKHNQIDTIVPKNLHEDKDVDVTKDLPTIEMPRSFRAIYGTIDYLEKRGVTEEMIKEYDIRFSKYLQRVIFPVRINGRLVGWQGRDILGEEKRKLIFTEEYAARGYLKSLNSRGSWKAKVLLHYDEVKDKDYIVLVEGPFDAVKTPNSVALLGCKLSTEQLNLLLKTKAKHIVIAIDPEESVARQMIYEILNPFFEISFVILSMGTDPGSHTREQMQQYVNKAMSNPIKKNLELNKKDLTSIVANDKLILGRQGSHIP